LQFVVMVSKVKASSKASSVKGREGKRLATMMVIYVQKANIPHETGHVTVSQSCPLSCNSRAFGVGKRGVAGFCQGFRLVMPHRRLFDVDFVLDNPSYHYPTFSLLTLSIFDHRRRRGCCGRFVVTSETARR